MSTPTLRQRAAGQEVERRPEGQTLRQQIQQMQSQFALAMPRGAEAAQLVRDAITCLSTNAKLADAEPRSVLGALMTCAQLGLRPGVLGQAWVLPFWDYKSRTNKAQLVIGYQGLVELAHRSGRVKSLIARTVFANDTFDVDYGLADNLIHKPALRGERGEPVAYYAIVKLVTGGHAFYVMSHPEMTTYRDRYAMAKNKDGAIVGPWRDNFEGMAHKTCVRQLSKWMPKSTELAQAIQADNSIRFDLTPTADPASVSHHFEVEATVDGEVLPDQPEPPDAASPPPADPDPRPDAMVDRQRRHLFALLGKAHLRDDAARHQFASDQLGRNVTSFNDLSTGDAALLIAFLEAEAQRTPPPDVDIAEPPEPDGWGA